MVDHINGDSFVDCHFSSQSSLRALFGFWISFYAAVVAFCARSVFRSRLVARLLLSKDSSNRKVGLWVLSPATTPSEVFETREILLRALKRRHFSFVTVSLFCVAATLVSAAATSIANHTIVQHTVIRKTSVSGRLAKRDSIALLGLSDRTTSRANALARAHAPLNQLFDFIPDDESNWVYVPEEWNNTWVGECTFHMYPAVDLVVLEPPLGDIRYQSLIPGLGAFLPTWATLDDTKQGAGAMSSPQITPTNDTGAWDDSLITYAFGTAPYAGGNGNLTSTSTSTNVSFANVLLHHVGKGNNTLFLETAFRSDVHVVECVLNNSAPGEDQAKADVGDYDRQAGAIVGVYTTAAAEASAQGHNVVQPTAQDMLRYWQAYRMVSHGYYIHPVRRTLSVSLQVVQMRLSTLIFTIVTFFLALSAAIVSHWLEPVDEHGDRIVLPSSQLDWTVQAARQLHGEAEHMFHVDYAREREDLFFAVSTARRGLSRTQIVSQKDQSVSHHQQQQQQPFLNYFEPNLSHDNSAGLLSSSSSLSSSPLGRGSFGTQQQQQQGYYFDPYSLYDHSTGVASPPPAAEHRRNHSHGGAQQQQQQQHFVRDFDAYSLYTNSGPVSRSSTPIHPLSRSSTPIHPLSRSSTPIHPLSRCVTPSQGW